MQNIIQRCKGFVYNSTLPKTKQCVFCKLPKHYIFLLLLSLDRDSLVSQSKVKRNKNVNKTKAASQTCGLLLHMHLRLYIWQSYIAHNMHSHIYSLYLWVEYNVHMRIHLDLFGFISNASQNISWRGLSDLVLYPQFKLLISRSESCPIRKTHEVTSCKQALCS